MLQTSSQTTSIRAQRMRRSWRSRKSSMFLEASLHSEGENSIPVTRR